MTYVRLNQILPDPYTAPLWVQDVERATPFDTKEQAEAAKVRLANASGTIYDDQREYWYVVKA